MAKTKHITLKMYHGNSKQTLHHHEVACKALTSQGFHDVFTFMVFKGKPISQQTLLEMADL